MNSINFSGYMVLGDNNEDLYSLCMGGNPTLCKSTVEIVRDREYPNQPVVFWAQGEHTQTIFALINGGRHD